MNPGCVSVNKPRWLRWREKMVIQTHFIFHNFESVGRLFVNETGEQTKPDLHKLRQFDTESTDIAISELS